MPPTPLALEKHYSALGRGLLQTAAHQNSWPYILLPRSAVQNILPNYHILHAKTNSREYGVDRNQRACYTSYMDTSDQTHTILDIITSDDPAPLALIEAEAPESAFEYPKLTRDEETFALAVIETSGNIAAAYKMVFGMDAYMPLAKGKELLSKPAIALKIREITDAVQDASLISVGAHLDKLATIRDLSIVTGQLKTAYMAERSRGEAVGIYQKHDVKNKGGGTQAVQVNITMASKHDVNI